MRIFTKRSAIGLTWSPDGTCWGVHLRRVRDRCAVMSFWRRASTPNESLAATLAEGFRALGSRENTTVIVGGAGACCGFADVQVPKLGPDDTRNALSFQVGKYAPVSVDKIVWGYRTLAGGDDGQQRVRLIFLRESTWGRWVDAVSGLGQTIDLIIPPAAVVDPLLHTRSVHLPDSVSEEGFLILPWHPTGREISRPVVVPEQAFGAGPEPLALPELELRELGGRSADEQRGYTSAILLGMYGLTAAPATDRRTWVPVPYELRPRRHRHSRLVAVAAALYLLLVAAVGVTREYHVANAYFQQLRRECARVEQEIAAQEGRADPSEFIGLLGQELGDVSKAYMVRPSMTVALVELTRMIDSEAWVEDFEWNDGKIDIQLNMPGENVELVKKLEDSPVLADVTWGRTRKNRDGRLTVGLQMWSRFDPAPAAAAVDATAAAPENVEE